MPSFSFRMAAISRHSLATYTRQGKSAVHVLHDDLVLVRILYVREERIVQTSVMQAVSIRQTPSDLT